MCIFTSMKRCGIYTITNTVNNKIYVGSTTRLFSQRWGDHRVGLRAKKHANIHLQRAWNKYGEDVFKFKIIELVDVPTNILKREQFWIDKLNVYKIGYNRTAIAGNSYGIKRTKKQKQVQKELANWKYAVKAWTGQKHTDEAKAKIKAKRAKQVLLPWTDEMKKSISEKQKIIKLGNRNRMKYFNITATKGSKILKFKDMREAMQYFELKNNGHIGRVIRGIRSHWHGWVFTCAKT